MGRRIAALAFIFICTSFAWLILGSVTHLRTYQQDETLKKAVGQLWGESQKQMAPHIYYYERATKSFSKVVNGETVYESREVSVPREVVASANDIKVRLNLQQRKKGLLWYATYRVEFDGNYDFENSTDLERDFYFEYVFPTNEGIYDNFKLEVDGKDVEEIRPSDSGVIYKLSLRPGENANINVSYGSQGLDEWWYVFGSHVSQIRNFSMTMETDFNDINFPETSISPTRKIKTEKGWQLGWEYENLISGIQIGLEVPRKINPGPFVSRLAFYAPVSLFLFMFLIFIITTIRDIRIHPMNHFFVASAFFSFHLLMAYLADQVDIYLAFAISAVISIFLVVSYMRLVVGSRFALFEVGVSQLVYLVLFSYAFFLEGITGLTITILCIVTLFVVMQFTGRINWDEKFAQVKNQ